MFAVDAIRRWRRQSQWKRRLVEYDEGSITESGLTSIEDQAAPPTIERITSVTSGADGDIPGDVLIIGILNILGCLLVQRRLMLEKDVSDRWRAEHHTLRAARRAFAELRILSRLGSHSARTASGYAPMTASGNK